MCYALQVLQGIEKQHLRHLLGGAAALVQGPGAAGPIDYHVLLGALDNIARLPYAAEAGAMECYVCKLILENIPNVV